MVRNLGAIDLDLHASDLQDVTAAAEAVTVQGNRYPDELEARTGL